MYAKGLYFMKAILVHYRAFGSDVVFEFTAERSGGLPVADETLLEWVFRECNHVDGEEWISTDPVAQYQRLRSMSVGDEVMLLGEDGEVRRWRVAGCGWERVAEVR